MKQSLLREGTTYFFEKAISNNNTSNAKTKSEKAV